jgi:hypothetical protein
VCHHAWQTKGFGAWTTYFDSVCKKVSLKYKLLEGNICIKFSQEKLTAGDYDQSMLYASMKVPQ